MPENQPQPILVISHRRSGTHLLIDTLRNNFPVSTQSFLTLEQLYPAVQPNLSRPEFERELARERMIVKSHMDVRLTTVPFDPIAEITEFIETLQKRAKLIYVFRDGRDVLTSQFFYNAKLGPVPEKIYDFLMTPLKNFSGHRIAYWVFHVGGWIARDDVLWFSFEELLRNPAPVVEKLALWLGLPIPARITNVDMNAASAHNPQIKRTSVSPRKGTTGDYKNHWDERCLARFNEIASPLMEKLGYPI